MARRSRTCNREDQSCLSETAESELRQIVDYRNAAAHGDVDEVLGAELLVEFTEFMEALCESIVDFIQYDTLRRAKELGKAKVIDHVSERFQMASSSPRSAMPLSTLATHFTSSAKV